jgi:hypothetical protein
MSDPTVLLGLIGVFSTIVASVFGAMTWTQRTLVTVLKDQVSAGEKREALLIADNKEQAQTIYKMGASVDKLIEQGAQTVRLLEDVVYGRQQAQTKRRTSQ